MCWNQWGSEACQRKQDRRVLPSEVKGAYYTREAGVVGSRGDIPKSPRLQQCPSQFKLSTSIAMSQSEGWIDMLGLPIPDNIIGKGRQIFQGTQKLMELQIQ